MFSIFCTLVAFQRKYMMYVFTKVTWKCGTWVGLKAS